MITFFDVLQVGGMIFGGMLGYGLGYEHLGVLGGIGGGVSGVVIGWIVGRLPFVVILAFTLHSIKRASTTTLRERLEREPFISHLIISNLIARGEPISSFEGVIERQVASSSPLIRDFGIRNVQRWFPHLKEATEVVTKGHTDPVNLRKLLIYTTSKMTAPMAETYFAGHRHDQILLQMLVEIALEGEDAGDAPWAAANTIANFPAEMLLPYRTSLKALSEHQWTYLHIPARQALAKISAETA